MKQFVKLFIGALVYACWRLLSPRRLAAVREQFFASHSLSFLERQVQAFILWRAPSSTQIASHCWSGRAGSRFHEGSDHRLTLDVVAADDFYRRPMLDEFAQRAATALQPGAAIVEVGCGAGGNLLYLRRKLAPLGFRYQGYDINEEVIASTRGHNCDDLAFAVRNCFSSELRVPGSLGLICCAVLMYVEEADIKRFLSALVRNNTGRILLGVSEPIGDPEAAQASGHNNLAFLHGYRRIFRELQFRQLFETFRQEPGKSSRIYHSVYDFPR